jgi:hypothetical protein
MTCWASNGFVVHANTHGFDNSVDLDAVAQSAGRYLAVVRLDASATPQLARHCIRRARVAFASHSIRSMAANWI